MRVAPSQAQILDKLSELPPFSPVLVKLLGTFGQANISCGTLAGLIEQDPVMAGSVLRLANSSLYSQKSTVTSIAAAINLIGTDRLRNVVTALSVSQMWKRLPAVEGWSTADFNEHGLAVAILGATLADQMPNDFAEGAFLAGLLHGVGKLLVVMAAPDDYREILRRYEAEGNTKSWVQLERDVLDTDHPSLSALALEQWKIAEPIRRAVAWHQDPELGKLSQVIWLADSLANAIGYSVLPPKAVLLEQDPVETVGPWLRQHCPGLPPGELLDTFHHEMDVIRGAPRTLRS
ncbi:MAG: HDOD domain-containing protein [Bryobacteraceae bacterium]|nr:HDOD domain-containing protein [Bryobacteraceae bacterium]